MLRNAVAGSKAKSLLTSILCTSFFAIVPASVSAQDVGASERVNFSGKLRMLSQRVAAAACNYSAGVEAEGSLAVLVGAQKEFIQITHGLEFGDAELNMNGEEERRKTIRAIHNLHQEWSVMSDAIDNVANGNDVDTNVSYINQHNMEVLSHAKVLVSEISGQYSDPFEMHQANALLVDYSGRQRMLTQKMSKESCQVWSGNAAAADALEGTMQMFELTLIALRSGNANAGIRPAPNANIGAGLTDIWEDWVALKPTLEKAVANETVDVAQRADVFAKLNVMLREMNAVVGLYTIFGKTGA